ncbi:HPr family phosphocarrier protein [Gryllotalpicola reticulitermitis]|uniref:Phosphocarrier protein HPr n=1 Tax=Gryllotalpicola reticulitermitis TaxID=1184153 RepID=A0ABV8QBS5_9MICO
MSRDSRATGSAAHYARTVMLSNPDGLHARSAAEFVKLAARFPARVTINGKDARSLLAILSLGLMRGASCEIASDEESGRTAVDALAELVGSGFARQSVGVE